MIRAALCLALMASTAVAAPKSAIPWLSDVMANPAPEPAPIGITPTTGLTPISVTPLSTDQSDGIGLLPGSITGLPRNLWQGMSSLRARKAIEVAPFGGAPETRWMLRRLLLADATAPIGAGASDAFLLARIDKLVAIGALGDAEALLDQIDTPTPALFSRWFNIKLLNNQAEIACERLGTVPRLSPGRAFDVFCLAKNGNWDAADLTLSLGRRLGEIDADKAALLAYFLDPEEADAAAIKPPASPLTPFEYVTRQSAGLDIPDTKLPLAFTYRETDRSVPVRFRLEALEPLVRKELIDAAPLFAAYREETPAASGGIWDRVKLVQQLDQAVIGPEISKALAALDAAFAPRNLRFAAADEYHGKLAALSPSEIPSGHHDLVATYLILAADYPAAAHWVDDESHSAIRVAFRPDATPQTDVEKAVHAAFRTPTTAQITDRSAEFILDAMAKLAKDPPLATKELTDGLRILRETGQERSARLIAAQTLLLDLEFGHVGSMD